MDEEWVKNPKNNPPPELVMVEIKGCDYMGEWISKAMRKDYKPGATKSQMKRGWRWVDEYGIAFVDQYVEEWRHITPYSERKLDE